VRWAPEVTTPGSDWPRSVQCCHLGVGEGAVDRPHLVDLATIEFAVEGSA
jgi:hypothetical protein